MKKKNKKKGRKVKEKNDENILRIHLNFVNEVTLPDSNEELIHPVIRRKIDQEYSEYREYITNQYETKLANLKKDQSIYMKGVKGDPRYFRKIFIRKGRTDRVSTNDCDSNIF